jgi:hypothetical protein
MQDVNGTYLTTFNDKHLNLKHRLAHSKIDHNKKKYENKLFHFCGSKMKQKDIFRHICPQPVTASSNIQQLL